MESGREWGRQGRRELCPTSVSSASEMMPGRQEVATHGMNEVKAFLVWGRKAETLYLLGRGLAGPRGFPSLFSTRGNCENNKRIRLLWAERSKEASVAGRWTRGVSTTFFIFLCLHI